MTETSPSEIFKAHCPRCNGQRSCNALGQLHQPWEFEEGPAHVYGAVTHRLLQCRGCELTFYWKSSWDSEDVDYDVGPQGETVMEFPSRVETHPPAEEKSRKPDWIWSLRRVDPALEGILSEVYDAAERRSNVLAATGLRTAFDRVVVKHHLVDEGLTLAGKVSALETAGLIGKTEAEALKVVVDAGSAAAHRGWRPSDAALDQLLGVLEHFIFRTVQASGGLGDVQASIPKRGSKTPSSAGDLSG